jgi:Protein of unknown function (DUF1570)
MLNRSRPIALEQSQVVGTDLSRRSCLLGWLLGATGLKAMDFTAVSAWAQGDVAEAKTIAQVQAAAKKAGLEPFRRSRSPHFLGLGDAPDRYRESALNICEELAKAFLTYFNFKGRDFTLALPQGRLTVITLKDDRSFKAFIGADPGKDVGGHYDLETNQLVVFDFRDKQADQPDDPVRVNLFSLIHETAHLLCFNTGLLSRQADVPVCVSEGLATFVEMWRPKQKTSLSAINHARLQVLDGQVRWIPIAELLADDKRFQDPKGLQLVYAESWLLAHYLIRPAQLPKFRAYLSGLPADGEPAEKRMKNAEEQLGSLAKLDHDLRRYAKSLLRK